MLAQDNLSAAVREIIALAAPDTSGCNCTVDRWDQYAMCAEAFDGATQALSFGVNGYDPWGEHVQTQHHMLPRLYDCFNTNKPTSFENSFSATCLGPREEVLEGRTWQTLPSFLAGASEHSALVKLDIETSEFEVLEELSAADFGRVAGLNVEYHFNYGCPDDARLAQATRLLRRVREHLAVVDSAAVYYNEPCLVGGAPFPKLLAVSYASRKACASQGSSPAGSPWPWIEQIREGTSAALSRLVNITVWLR